MSYTIIDRRLNSGDKNHVNRQRFLERARRQLKKSVKKGVIDRSISSDGDYNVHIPEADGIHEPVFRHDPYTGGTDRVLPGNHEYVSGDIIEKPQKGQGSGGKEGSEYGEGEDGFTFPISKDEFHDILFEDLELPNLKKKSEKDAVSWVYSRCGYANNGTPSTMDLLQTMRRSIGRRIALRKPKDSDITMLEEELALLEKEMPKSSALKDQIIEMKSELRRMKKRQKAIPYIDPIDLRYRNFEPQPKPRNQAVMFCVMDVSASMGDREKGLAKRFYLLLYLFLQYKYDKVDIVFIRHHIRGIECTEEEFFYSRETGGTVVSSGFEVMMQIQKERYDLDDWNIYVAQASDGDNFAHDNDTLRDIITDQVLPITQFFAYIEVADMSFNTSMYYGTRSSDYGVWGVYRRISNKHEHMKMKKADSENQIYEVFRELFAKVPK